MRPMRMPITSMVGAPETGRLILGALDVLSGVVGNLGGIDWMSMVEVRFKNGNQAKEK
jgi:hypothetical protein